MAATVYRADTVGSVLRPGYLLRAREQYEAGQLAAAPPRRQDRGAGPRLVQVQQARGPDQLLARVDEASRFFPRDQLAVSRQCGFASAGPGNAISEADQAGRLRVVGEVTDLAWG